MKVNLKRILIFDIAVFLITVLSIGLVKPPQEVRALTVQAFTYNTVSLRWKDNKKSPKYNIYRSENGKEFEYIASTDNTEYIDNNLNTGSEYRYYVKASNGLKKSDKSVNVKAFPNFDAPSFDVNTENGVAEINIEPVDGAEKYNIYRNNKLIGSSIKPQFVDQEATPDKTQKYTVSAAKGTAEGDKAKEVKIKLISPGDIDAVVLDDSLLLSWPGNEKYSSYTVYNGDKKVEETSDFKCEIPAEIGDYDIRVVGTGETKSAPSKYEFAIEETEMDNAEAIKGAVDWAIQIADDDSFNYGRHGPANANGCYFCGTNDRKVSSTGDRRYEKTYMCMGFVTAAYAHGARDPEVLKICEARNSLSTNDNVFNQVSCFKKIGRMSELSVSDLQPGDVLVHYCSSSASGHMSMYAGDGDIVDANGNGFGSDTIAVRGGRAQRYLNMRLGNPSSKNFVMRYTGKGSGKMLKIVPKED